MRPLVLRSGATVAPTSIAGTGLGSDTDGDLFPGRSPQQPLPEYRDPVYAAAQSLEAAAQVLREIRHDWLAALGATLSLLSAITTNNPSRRPAVPMKSAWT